MIRKHTDVTPVQEPQTSFSLSFQREMAFPIFFFFTTNINADLFSSCQFEIKKFGGKVYIDPNRSWGRYTALHHQETSCIRFY